MQEVSEEIPLDLKLAFLDLSKDTWNVKEHVGGFLFNKGYTQW